MSVDVATTVAINEASTRTILVADDETHILHVVSMKLRNAGYNVVTARDGQEALDLATAEETPLVISDMKMPGRDGIWLLENFRQRFPDTSVIMLTGYGDTEAAVDCLRRGAVDYLLKPPKLTDLIRSIERALANARAAGEDVADVRLQMIESAKMAFYEYYLVYRSFAVNEESIRLLNEFRKNARTRHALSPWRSVQPRVCGERLALIGQPWVAVGSAPRVRGTLSLPSL